MAFQLARQQILIETDDVELSECLNNTHLSRYFISLARELDVLEPKVPEDIYKSHLENHRKKKREEIWLLLTFPITAMWCQ
jgi:26S proteasome regulatory subunit N1